MNAALFQIIAFMLRYPQHERFFIFANCCFSNPSALPNPAKISSPLPPGEGWVRVRLSTDAQIHPASIRIETTKQASVATLRPYPQPSLRATFSRWEKGIKSSVRIQRPRSLPKHISPTLLGPHIRITKPQMPIRAFPRGRVLHPQLGRHHRGIAPHPHRL